MTTWIIISWVFVVILTTVNVVVFLKLKKASEQMMKMAFPGSKNMGDAMSQMEKMMGSMGGGMGRPGAKGMQGMRGGNQDAQLKAAMDMLKQLQKR